MSKRFGKSAGELQTWYLREWRKHRGMTQEQLAEAIDSTKPTISRMENGQIPYNQPFLEACADALSCSAADLLVGPPGETSELSSIIQRLKSCSTEDLKKVSGILEAIGLK